MLLSGYKPFSEIYNRKCLVNIEMCCLNSEKHNQMWILKNSKELLEHLQSPNFNRITSIKSFDFSTLYTTIPHKKT